jgi:hypothetical protein
MSEWGKRCTERREGDTSLKGIKKKVKAGEEQRRSDFTARLNLDMHLRDHSQMMGYLILLR